MSAALKSGNPLDVEIAVLRELMSALQYAEESRWLAMAAISPDHCHSDAAQLALRHALGVAISFGFPVVCEWITGELLRAG